MAFQFRQGDAPLLGYTVQRGVGRGGFGEVYYALSDGGKEVALKYLRENPQIELRGVSHCLNLKSPHLVAIHDIKQSEHGDYFVIMEYVTGPSLRDLLNAEPAGLGAQKAAYFLREICKGLAYLHDRGIVHRDLKPGNIFYEDGYVKIGDYGLAKLMSASQHSGQTVSVGTVHYMAPEVGSGNYDRTIDIYALGVMLYEMLLGRVPFAGATMGEVLMKHLTAQPEVDELPAPFPHVIRKALAKDPKDRYQTVQEMLSELFSVKSIDESVAAIEPASLSTIAAKAAGQMQARHIEGTPGVATLTGVGGSSNVGSQAETQFAGFGAQVVLPKGRFERLQNRIGARVDRLAGRIDGSALGQQIAQAGQPTGRMIEKAVLAFLIMSGMSVVLSLLSDTNSKFQYAAISFMYMASILQGTILGTWFSYNRLKVAGVWVPRLIVAGFGAVALMASCELASHLLPGSKIGGWLKPLIVTMLVSDWAGRLYAGRQGTVSLGSAFSVGLFAFLMGIPFANGASISCGLLVAATSLATQAIASLWPLAPGETVPRTRSDDDENKETPQQEAETPAPVAVEPPGFHRTPSGGVLPPIPGSSGANRKVPVAPAILSPSSTETDPRLQRSSAIRALWLLLSIFALCGSVMLYATPHLIEKPMLFGPKYNEDMEIGAFSIFGTISICVFMYFFTRSWSGYKSGLWRGIVRPAVFFAGIATAASCGIGFGLLNPPKEALPVLLGGILMGALSSLFVWFVPVRPYRPFASQEDETQRKLRVAGRFRLAGIIVFCLGLFQSLLLLATLSGNDAEEAVPAVGGTMTMISLGLYITGFMMKRKALQPTVLKQEKLTLPLRAVFEVDANSNIGRLIERHMTAFGYRLASKSDLLWSFERGTWAAQFWQNDVRQWKVKFNVAAYELDTGGFRVTCFLDLDAPFNQPDQSQLVALQSEIADLRGLLGGRDTPSGMTVPTPAVSVG